MACLLNSLRVHPADIDHTAMENIRYEEILNISVSSYHCAVLLQHKRVSCLPVEGNFLGCNPFCTEITFLSCCDICLPMFSPLRVLIRLDWMSQALLKQGLEGPMLIDHVGQIGASIISHIQGIQMQPRIDGFQLPICFSNPEPAMFRSRPTMYIRTAYGCSKLHQLPVANPKGSIWQPGIARMQGSGFVPYTSCREEDVIVVAMPVLCYQTIPLHQIDLPGASNPGFMAAFHHHSTKHPDAGENLALLSPMLQIDSKSVALLGLTLIQLSRIQFLLFISVRSASAADILENPKAFPHIIVACAVPQFSLFFKWL